MDQSWVHQYHNMRWQVRLLYDVGSVIILKELYTTTA
jgi:hypothetical protein